MVRAWWATQAGHVTPLWLPVSTHTLDLMERVWRFLKQELACHRYLNDVAGLDAAASILLGRIAANVQTADPSGIRLVNNFCEAA